MNILILDEKTSVSNVKCTDENCLKPKAHLITDRNTGEVLCSRCGLVLAEKLEDTGPEQHVFTNEQYLERTRTGGKSTLAIDDMGLATVIDSKDKDASGNSLSSDMKSTFSRLRIWDNRSKSRSTERSLRSAFIILNTMKMKLVIPDTVIEKSAYLYRKALAKKMTKGRSISALALASLYTACREANAPRSLQDIASAGNVSVKDLSRHIRILINSLDLKVESYDSSDFINRIASTAGISERTRRDALDILSNAKGKGILAGKNPVAMAATALYLSCMSNAEKQSQRKISKASGISVVTIRNRAESLTKVLNLYNILAKHTAYSN
ncbi:MAG TPA: transcription initiation factor IIB [Nitrosopumilaceae archaeon]|nr:transcription initiation factor IIB [Nitrosopumilaceae archaeon]